jgi:hypothetical protein
MRFAFCEPNGVVLQKTSHFGEMRITKTAKLETSLREIRNKSGNTRSTRVNFYRMRQKYVGDILYIEFLSHIVGKAKKMKKI